MIALINDAGDCDGQANFKRCCHWDLVRKQIYRCIFILVYQIPPACSVKYEHQNLFEQCEALDTANTQCIQGCKQNRTLVEYSKQSCVNGIFLPFICIDGKVVKLCENETFVSKHNRLQSSDFCF